MASNINDTALHYWQLTGYTRDELQNFCKSYDQEFMIALVTFKPDAPANVSISMKTWQRQEGHYGSIVEFFSCVAATEVGKTLDGSVVIWLEDGNFEYTRDRTRKVPVVAFGRSIDDHHTLLMPDPSFLGDYGYKLDIAKIDSIDTVPFAKKGKSIFWRGAATGSGIHGKDWVNCARGRLVLKALEVNDPSILDAKITKYDHLPEKQQKMLERKGVTGTYLDFEKFLTHGYLVDADGYHCAWRSLFLKLASRSVTVKISSNLEQWYHRDIYPWVHYVPLMYDLSDVVDIHGWMEAHPEACQQIIRNANEFIATMTLEREIENVTALCKKLISLERKPS